MSFVALLDALRQAALAYPEAYEEQPWGEYAAKVRKTSFAFWSMRDADDAPGQLTMTMKLGASHEAALAMPECEPSGYGLGKHGWVTARFSEPTDVDLPTLLDWLEESYRRVAPKTLSRSVPPGGPVSVSREAAPEVPADAPNVVVVSDDALRSQRALDGLAHRGLRALRATTSDLDDLSDADAVAFLVDLGRSASVALGLAEDLALLHFDRPLVLAGIRDARAEEAARRALEGADSVWFLRDPPGDPAVLDALIPLCAV